MKLAIGLALLICAAVLAAVGWVLAKPRWRWDPPLVDEVEPLTFDADVWARQSNVVFQFPDGSVGPGNWNPEMQRVEPAIFGTGSPWSVTSRADNGTALDPRPRSS